MPQPRRGELYWVDFNAARGSEQAGLRPALVIQNDIGNERAATTIVAAVSTTHRPMPQHVCVEPGDIIRVSSDDAGLRDTSEVKTEQILTIAKERLQRRIGALTQQKMGLVNWALRVSLAL